MKIRTYKRWSLHAEPRFNTSSCAHASQAYPVACPAPSTQTWQRAWDAASVLSSALVRTVYRGSLANVHKDQLQTRPLRSSGVPSPHPCKSSWSFRASPTSLLSPHMHMVSPGTLSLPPLRYIPSSALNLRTNPSHLESNKPVTKGKYSVIPIIQGTWVLKFIECCF